MQACQVNSPLTINTFFELLLMKEQRWNAPDSAVVLFLLFPLNFPLNHSATVYNGLLCMIVWMKYKFHGPLCVLYSEFPVYIIVARCLFFSLVRYIPYSEVPLYTLLCCLPACCFRELLETALGTFSNMLAQLRSVDTSFESWPSPPSLPPSLPPRPQPFTST